MVKAIESAQKKRNSLFVSFKAPGNCDLKEEAEPSLASKIY
jgi:hypothetical protein